MYDSISEGSADGYGQGPNGYGQGYVGSFFGGDPGGGGAQIPGGVGGAQPPVTVNGPGSITAGGGGMSPGEGLSSRRMQMGGRPQASAAQGSLKPMLSQMLGLSPQQPMGQRRGLGGPQRRPGMGGPGRPIQVGPRPITNPAPQPAPGGGTLRGGQGRGPVTSPVQRGRVQPGKRQGTI